MQLPSLLKKPFIKGSTIYLPAQDISDYKIDFTKSIYEKNIGIPSLSFYILDKHILVLTREHNLEHIIGMK